MNSKLSFILKVLLLSLIITLVIKYLAPHFPVRPTALNALIAVLSPSLILAALFLWRGQSPDEFQGESQGEKDIN